MRSGLDVKQAPEMRSLKSLPQLQFGYQNRRLGTEISLATNNNADTATLIPN